MLPPPVPDPCQAQDTARAGSPTGTGTDEAAAAAAKRHEFTQEEIEELWRAVGESAGSLSHLCCTTTEDPLRVCFWDTGPTPPCMVRGPPTVAAASTHHLFPCASMSCAAEELNRNPCEHLLDTFAVFLPACCLRSKGVIAWVWLPYLRLRQGSVCWPAAQARHADLLSALHHHSSRAPPALHSQGLSSGYGMQARNLSG